MNDFARSAGKWIVVIAAIGLVRFGLRAATRTAPRSAPTALAETAPPPVAAPAPPAPDNHAEARRARDAMRAQILEALRRRETEKAPAAVPAAAPAAHPAEHAAAEEEPPPKGKYEPSYIQKTFRENMFPILKQCYEASLKDKPALRGRLVLKFSIVGDPQVGGVVEDASIGDESDLKDPELETCARESLLALTFDKPPSGGGLVTVTYPIAFSPGDDEEEQRAGDAAAR